jgi:hypothetical protein
MIPYLRVANVLDGYIDYSDVYRMHFSPTEQQKYTVRAGDILLNEGQSTELVGRSALYDGPENRYCFQNSLVNFRSGPSVHPPFARLVFKRWLDIGHFTTIVKQTTSMAHLGGERFANLEFPVPPLSEQRQIAAILDTIDDAIRKTEQIIAKLKQVKQGLLHNLLTRGIDDNGELRDPERHPEQFKDSVLGRIPKCWETRKLGELSNVVRGSTPRPAKDPRYFDGSDTPWITVGELSRDDWPFLTETTSMLTKLGTRFSRRLELYPAFSLLLPIFTDSDAAHSGRARSRSAQSQYRLVAGFPSTHSWAGRAGSHSRPNALSSNEAQIRAKDTSQSFASSSRASWRISSPAACGSPPCWKGPPHDHRPIPALEISSMNQTQSSEEEHRP